MFGDSNQTRDFTYVSNVVDANVLAASASGAVASGIVVNVGAGEQTSLLDLIQLIRAVTGRRLAYENAAPRQGDVKDSLAGLDRARAIIGYQPAVSLREGLVRTWHWFENTEPDTGRPSTPTSSSRRVAAAD